MPLHDWQFWVVTALAMAALVIMLRTLIPRRKARGPGCPTCTSGTAGAAQKRRVALTIERRRV